MSVRSEVGSGSTWQHEVFRYGDIEETAEFCARARLGLAEARSLRSHPYAQPDDPAGVLLRCDGVTVGSIRLIPGRVRIGSADFGVSWTSTWEFTGERGESVGAGLLLVRALEEAGSVAVCGVSDRSRDLFRFARFDHVVVPRHVLIFKSRAVLERRIGIRSVARALALPLDAAFAAARAAARFRAAGRRDYHLERIDRFDPKLDEVDAESRGPLWFPRDYREINWALDHPWFPPDEYRYQAFYLHRRMSGVIGYALTRVRTIDGSRIASLLRAAIRPDCAPGSLALLVGLASAAFEEHADALEVCTTNRRLRREAAGLGMIARGSVDLMGRLGHGPTRALQELGSKFSEFDADYGEGDLLFF